MLERIAQNLNIILDKKLEDEAILNALQAKLCHIFSFKNVKFISSENMMNPYPISYYAFNFVPSGGSKNRLLKEISTNLLNFFDDELISYHKMRQEALKTEQQEYITNHTDKFKDNDFKKLVMQQEKEVTELKKLPAEISASTQANVYEVLKMIKKAKYGSILIKNTEFANFYEDAIAGKDKTKKEFLDMLFDLYDGDYDASCAVSTNRENLTGLPVSCVLMSDYELILQDGNLSKSFKSWLKRGMARRSFIYYKKGGHKPKVKLMSTESKQLAYDYLSDASKILKDIYNSIVKDKIYEFSKESNKCIFDYKMQVLEKINKMFEVNDVLDENATILRLNLENSTWKIIKLAVVYHILESPGNTLIKPSSFKKAVDFFSKTHLFLSDLISSNSISDFEKLFAYLTTHINKWHNKTELKAQNFVNERAFSHWYNEAIFVIQEMVTRRGLGYAERKSGKNNCYHEIAIYDYEHKCVDGVISIANPKIEEIYDLDVE